MAHVAALPGDPYDGHTLAKVVPEITQQIGVGLQRIVADAGYRGHNAPKNQGLSGFTSGQKRGVTDEIKRELRRRSAVQPVIGHLKADHRMQRNYLKWRVGDAANVLLTAVGYNFSLLLARIAILYAFFTQLITDEKASSISLKTAFFTGDYLSIPLISGGITHPPVCPGRHEGG